ncbi:allergen V5 Tpx-1 family [Micractinium conductrix]|uniref:Allergen V5 Tpx-1 family n=1 Tax=Micractinium conductrix TaxID=554055 RepID=A0A2P6VEM2_9CHLO|nr:allergen V5 Tpx-1 family [Micractinium conductrix]|eukprot:PSC72543.1 allergen V5 Tpx-1 family [Micractinium conductrix]
MVLGFLKRLGHLPGSHHDDAEGSLIGGRYKVIHKLVKGAYATVYMVEGLDGRRFALKKTDIATMGEADRRTAVNELLLLASLHHPKSYRPAPPQFNEAFVEGDALCCVMGLCLGGSLHQVISAHAELGSRIPEAQQRRDIMPANLLLVSGSGLLKIADLGVAGVLANAVGTTGFASPEVTAGRTQPASDCFSLGMCLYELCMRRSPFGAASEAAVAAAVQAWGPADAAEAAAALFPDYIPELVGLLQALLQPDPSARPTAGQILERHATQQRLATLPQPPAGDACGRRWDAPRAADSTGASTGASAGAGGVALAAAGGAATTCRNRLTNCAKWKANGYCAATWFYNDRSVGSYWCRKTCRKCGTTTGGTTTGGTTTGGTTACPPPPPPSPRPDVGIASSWQVSLLSLVNSARAKAGAPPLCLNAALTKAAQDHSQDQAKRRDMSHTGGDGSDVGQRALRVGYSWRAVGENVAWGYSTVQAVFDSWMGSPGHRANILSTAYKHTGLGQATSDGIYWTQVFGNSVSQGCT